MKISRLLASGIVLSLISSSPATALFGSECRKPKASFNEQIALSKKLKKEGYYISPGAQATFELEKKKSDLPVEPPGDTRKLLKSKKALDTAYRIVLNNQKCFDPIIVVEAQRFRSK